MRHGIAVARSAGRRHRDADRRLTARGAEKVRRIAKALKRRNVSFDVILSSPFRRAKETADVVASVFKCRDRIALSLNLRVGGDPEAFVREMHSRYGRLHGILAVGHEPYLSSLISILLSGDTQMRVTMKKGGVCKLSAAHLRYGRCASLEWLIPPGKLLPGE